MGKQMRLFFFLICFVFLNTSIPADNVPDTQKQPDAFVKRSYTPTFAQLILARSTGRPYIASPLVASSKTVLSKPLFSGPLPVSGLQSAILDKLKPYDIYIRHYSRIHDLDPNLVRAVIYVESAGDPNAVSVDGAMGLMQLMPATAGDMGVKSPHEPAQNIFGGTRYLSRLMDRFGSLDLALWAYNAGPELVKRKRLPLETRRYIPKVMRIKRQLDEGI
jgi:soluble lytic murein transglycosylase-like protein